MIFKFFVQCLMIRFVLSASRHPVLIVVSYDAFGYNFFDNKLTPNMERLKKVGTHADYLINVFPTKTFPNHHSIATGLYPEVHGVIGNSYYNATTKNVTTIGYEMYHYSDDIKPIWRWNEDQGQDRYSASMMWPGADFAYQGKNITHVKCYNSSVDWFERIDTVIEWLTDSIKPANLVMLYIEEPDTHGHVFGTNSVIVKNLLQKLDNITEYLESKLKQHNLDDITNVIHLSDHGMVSVTPPHFINVTQYLKNGTYVRTGASPCMQIIPHKGYEDEIYNSLRQASLKNGHFKVYRKKDYPNRWHYKSNTRSPPIFIMADVGYALDDYITLAPKYAAYYNFTLTNTTEFGVHGYDYDVNAMHPYFMARGPKIKKLHKVAPFNTVDLFNLFTQILELPALTNNGSVGNIIDIIAEDKGKLDASSILAIIAGGALLVIVLVGIATIIVIVIMKRQQNITTIAALNKRFPQTFQKHEIEAQHLLEPEDA